MDGSPYKDMKPGTDNFQGYEMLGTTPRANFIIDRPETNERYRLIIVPKFKPNSPKAKIARSPEGFPGTYQVTFAFSIPGCGLYSGKISLSQMINEGESLIELPGGKELKIDRGQDFSRADRSKEQSFSLLSNDQGVLSRTVVDLEASSFLDAERKSFDLIMPLISWFSFQCDVSLDISGYEILEKNTDVRVYALNMIGQRKKIDIQDGQEVRVPSTAESRALLAVYREALNSTNIFYQILSFYKVIEGMKKLRKKQRKVNKKSVQAINCPNERIPEREEDLGKLDSNVLASFRPHLGKKFSRVIEENGKLLRNTVAHLDPKKIVLSPDNYDDILACEKAKPVLKYISRIMLQNELQPGQLEK